MKRGIDDLSKCIMSSFSIAIFLADHQTIWKTQGKRETKEKGRGPKDSFARKDLHIFRLQVSPELAKGALMHESHSNIPYALVPCQPGRRYSSMRNTSYLSVRTRNRNLELVVALVL